MESRVEDPTLLLPGTEVGSWRVISQRGQGAYGVVYRVEKVNHPEEGPFALKLASTPRDPRFEREIELLSRIDHPHVPKLHGRGWWMGPGEVPFPYLVMEWVEGVSLYEWAAQHPLTPHQEMRLLAQVARALEATHRADCVHRDVKGANVLVRTKDAQALLMDFGAGEFRGARTLTREPLPPGTPQYRSPEALRFLWKWRKSSKAHYQASPADDVYALGVMAYRLVTGFYPPETKQTLSETMVAMPPKLRELISQMLSTAPSARGSAAEVAQALEEAIEPAKSQGEPPINVRATPVPMVRRTGAEPSRDPPAWLVGLIVAASSVPLAIVAAWGVMQRQFVEGAPIGSAQEAREEGIADGESVGVGDTAPTTPVSAVPLVPERDGIALDMPNKPFPGQRQPPCEPPEIEINGGCWVGLIDATPPCGSRSYEWKKRCYWPSFAPPRPSTSEQP